MITDSHIQSFSKSVNGSFQEGDKKPFLSVETLLSEDLGYSWGGFPFFDLFPFRIFPDRRGIDSAGTAVVLSPLKIRNGHSDFQGSLFRPVRWSQWNMGSALRFLQEAVPLMIHPLLDGFRVLMFDVAETALELQVFPDRKRVFHQVFLDHVVSVFNFIERKDPRPDSKP